MVLFNNTLIMEDSMKKRNIIISLSITFLLAIFLGYFLLNEELAQKFSYEFIKNKENILINGKISSIGLFINNVRASFIMVVIGFIPFLFLPYFGAFANGFIIGAIGKMLTFKKMNLFKTFLMGILPHGIFEIPALIYAMFLGVTFCLNITKKLLKKDRENFSDLFRKNIMNFVKIVVPLLIIAALIEAYVTPLLLK